MPPLGIHADAASRSVGRLKYALTAACIRSTSTRNPEAVSR